MTNQSSVSTPTDDFDSLYEEIDFDALYEEIQTKGPDHLDIVEKMNRMDDDQIDRYCEYEASRKGLNIHIVRLTYDSDERSYSIGDDSTSSSQTYTFILTGNEWNQIDGNRIERIDGECGKTLLAHLNADGKFAGIAIKNSNDEFLYSAM
jgi:hypothetical protein